MKLKPLRKYCVVCEDYKKFVYNPAILHSECVECGSRFAKSAGSECKTILSWRTIGMKDFSKTLRVGDIKTLCVESFGSKGHPVCKLNGFVIFINTDRDLKMGDIVKGEIVSIRPNFAFATVCKAEEETDADRR